MEPLRDGCKCPICHECQECPQCHDCPSCPEYQPCLQCKPCQPVERCKKCQTCKRCKEPVVFYVPNFAPLDPSEEGIPSVETSNIKPGMCCRCPKRKTKDRYESQFYDKTMPEPLKPIDAETGKYIDGDEENGEMEKAIKRKSKRQIYFRRFKKNQEIISQLEKELNVLYNMF